MTTSYRWTLTLQLEFSSGCISEMGKCCIKIWRTVVHSSSVRLCLQQDVCTSRWCWSRENSHQINPGVAFLPTRPCNWSCSHVNLLVSCLMSVTVCQLQQQRFTVSILKSGDLTDSWYFLRVLCNFCFCTFYLFSLQFMTTIIWIYINV